MHGPIHSESVASLPIVEHALLWSLRARAVGACRGLPVAERIGEVFGSLGAPEAMPFFDGFLWALGRGARRPLDLHCVCAERSTADESALLDALALVQAGRRAEALASLDDMLTPGGASACCDSAARMMPMLAAAGHRLDRAAGALHRHACRPPPAWRAMAAFGALH